MTRYCSLLIWPIAAAVFAADGADVPQTFHVQVPAPGSQVSLGMALMPRGARGVDVAAVAPGGPADRAGLVAGDVLLSINDSALDGTAALPPIARWFDALAGVAAGDSVRVEYLRGSERLITDVVADPSQASTQQFGAVTTAAPNVAFGAVAMAAGAAAPNTLAYGSLAGGRPFAGRAVIGGLELFDVDAGLGHYFGVESGVLVLRAPPDAGLLAGDVVRSIDGEPVVVSAQCVGMLVRLTGAAEVEVLRDDAVQIVQYTLPQGGAVLLPLPSPGTAVTVTRGAPAPATPTP